MLRTSTVGTIKESRLIINIKNIMNKLALLIAMCAALLSFSCSSKQDPLCKLEDLAYRLSNESDGYSSVDWEDVAEKYVEIEEELMEYDYTDDELREIGRLKAQCLKSIMHASATMMKGQLHNMEMQMEGASEVLDDMEDEFDDDWEEIEDEIDGITDEFESIFDD